MKALIFNCSPVRAGATAEIVKLVLEQLSAKYSVKSICIDRCTPWCSTHEPHATIKRGRNGYAIALRTGPNMPE